MSERLEIDVAVIGAGVVGLAVAAELVRGGREVFVFERGSQIGCGISSRNSEVVHSGIYYPHGSLKHRLCIEGRHLIYRFCEDRGIPHRRCGKLVVATSDEEVDKIAAIAARAKENGVENTVLLDRRATLDLEPELRAVAALHVAETGIVDSHALMLALEGDVEAGGGAVLLGHDLVGGALAADRFDLDFTVAGGEALGVRARTAIVAAGPWSHAVLSRLGGGEDVERPGLRLAKGSYFTYVGRPAFSRLIYPAPVDGGLGTHLTLDLGGRMRFGPDVEWLDERDPDAVDFTVDATRAEGFRAAIRRYWPGLRDDALAPDYSGVRPKLSGPGEAAADFRIEGPRRHGISGLVSLLGIESPGLTSALALGVLVRDELASA